MREVHVVDLRKLIKIFGVRKILFQNLTRCKKVDSKSDKTKKILFII